MFLHAGANKVCNVKRGLRLVSSLKISERDMQRSNELITSIKIVNTLKF